MLTLYLTQIEDESVSVTVIDLVTMHPFESFIETVQVPGYIDVNVADD